VFPICNISRVATMKSSFGARRKARVIAQDDDDQDAKLSGAESTPGMNNSCFATHANSSTGSAVKRPPLKSKRPSSRLSFGRDATTTDDSDGVFTPKKSTLSQQAIERNALRKSALKSSLSSDRLPKLQQEDRPSYSKEYLAELKGSTPTTPQREHSIFDDAEVAVLDVAQTAGTDLSTYKSVTLEGSVIPTDAEIQEKKARRARLARELKYKTGDSDEEDEDNHFLDEARDSDEDEFRTQVDRIGLDEPHSRSKYPETRLVHEDEDILEDFDTFVEDGKISLGRKAEREQKKKAREHMRELIDEAEARSEEDSDDSERERREVYEALQTRKGMEGLSVQERNPNAGRPRTPPRIVPLPSLGNVLEKLRIELGDAGRARDAKMEQLESIERERKEIAEREVEIQRLLKETAERYERLRMEAGLGNSTSANGVSVEGALALQIEAPGQAVQRGLESLLDNTDVGTGGTPIRIDDED
jgi:hypothetical protein